MRIATWNVERPRPRGWKVPPAQQRRMAEVDADIWVLTETHLGHAPTPDHVHRAFSPPHPDRRPEPERWAAVWSRWPLQQVEDPAPHRRGTTAALVETPSGALLVYASVIAWANEPHFDDGTKAPMWGVHLTEIERQGGEWARLRSAHPETPMVVAGDLNQDRDGSGWYGTAETRRALTDAMREADLVCLTDFDAVAAGALRAQHLVDHICVTPDLVDGASLQCWEPVDTSGQRLSDHPVVAVTW